MNGGHDDLLKQPIKMIKINTQDSQFSCLRNSFIAGLGHICISTCTASSTQQVFDFKKDGQERFYL